jgi:TatD DNase family protein
MLVDAHTHLDVEALDADLDAVVARARAAGVAWWLICGSDPDAWDHTEAVAARTGGVAALGVHPWVAAELSDSGVDAWIEALATRSPRIVGEIGLDALWYRDDTARARQRRAVRAQLALARERDVPVVLHCVRAYPELLALVERDGLPAAGGMVHGWSGPPGEVARALRLGLHVSFGPLVLRDKARKARQSVAEVPLDRLLVETDCPSMAPLGVERGEPAHVVQVAAEVAALRGVDAAEVAAATNANAERLLRGER